MEEHHAGQYLVGAGCGCASGVIIAFVVLFMLLCHHGIG